MSVVAMMSTSYKNDAACNLTRANMRIDGLEDLREICIPGFLGLRLCGQCEWYVSYRRARTFNKVSDTQLILRTFQLIG